MIQVNERSILSISSDELATFQKPFLGDGIFDIFSSIVKDETPSIQNLYSKDLNRILKM